MGDLVVREEVEQGGRLQASLFLWQIQRTAAGQRCPNFPLRHVKTNTGYQR
ncbi:hypothetical protein D3C75_1018890 [compost metagenome]